MSKEVTIYGYNSVETSVSKNPDRIIELYVAKSTSNKRIDKLLSSSAVSKLSIKRVDKSFLSDLLSTEKHQGIAANCHADAHLTARDNPARLGGRIFRPA